MKSYNFIAEVPSKSNPNKRYTIKVDAAGLFSCNCPSWIFNQRGNRTCKHVDALRIDGITMNGQGRLITAVDKGGKIPILCKNYPDQCDTCKMRFLCWTSREAEFDADTLRDMGVLNGR